jgi:hypothetical protein
VRLYADSILQRSVIYRVCTEEECFHSIFCSIRQMELEEKLQEVTGCFFIAHFSLFYRCKSSLTSTA